MASPTMCHLSNTHPHPHQTFINHKTSNDIHTHFLSATGLVRTNVILCFHWLKLDGTIDYGARDQWETGWCNIWRIVCPEYLTVSGLVLSLEVGLALIHVFLFGHMVLDTGGVLEGISNRIMDRIISAHSESMTHAWEYSNTHPHSLLLHVHAAHAWQLGWLLYCLCVRRKSWKQTYKIKLT